MYTLIGTQHKQGDFVDDKGAVVKYDYIALFFTTDEVAVDHGCFAGVVKAKPDQLKIDGAKSLEQAIGREVIMIPDLTNPKYIRRVMVL